MRQNKINLLSELLGDNCDAYRKPQSAPAKWARDCPWMPWMKLGYGNPAKLRFETTIFRVDNFEQLNPKLVKLVREKVPIYEFTPEESEEPNITSIQYFKKNFESYLRGDIFPLEETS